MDESRGPVDASYFPDGEKNVRFKKQERLDIDGFAQVDTNHGHD